MVIAHNNWTSYETGERWNIIFDIVPAQGNHILMDGMAGLIHSGDDFGVNSAGIMITETTISRFSGFDPDGIPEFVRARKAMQYSASIDDFARIMKEGNNGGYANNWLVADRKTNEIASLELGLKNVTLQAHAGRLFRGLQLPGRRETDARRDRFRPEESERQRQRAPRALAAADGAEQGQDRRARGRSVFWPTISTPTRTKWIPTSARCAATSTCRRAARCRGRGLTRRWARCNPRCRMPPWPKRMTLRASLGHSCGIGFKAAGHLRKHTEFAWQRPRLRDMPSRPWTTFSAHNDRAIRGWRAGLGQPAVSLLMACLKGGCGQGLGRTPAAVEPCGPYAPSSLPCK